MDKNTILHAIAGADNQLLHLNTVLLCGYVLENGNRILTKDSVQKGMGYHGTDTNWLHDFLFYLDKYRQVDTNLLAAVKSDILFKTKMQNEPIIKRGIDPQILLQACETIVKFKEDGFLFVSELKFAKAAEEIVKNLTYNTNALIDFSSGFDLYKYNYKNALCRIIPTQHPYYRWANTFPDDFYHTIFQLKKWNWTDLRTLYASQYIHEIVFSRIDSALLEVLMTIRPKIKHQKKNIFQKYVEHPQLQPIVQSIITFIKASNHNEQQFLQLLNMTYPILNENAYENNVVVNNASIEAQFPHLTDVLKTILSVTKN